MRRGDLHIGVPEWDVIRSFNAEGVKYIIVGSVAARFHGGRKIASDLDLLIERSAENAESVDRALRGVGLAIGSAVAELCKPKKTQVRLLPRYGIDILTEVAGASFEDIHRGRRPIQSPAGEVSIASAEHVAVMKGALGGVRLPENQG